MRRRTLDRTQGYKPGAARLLVAATAAAMALVGVAFVPPGAALASSPSETAAKVAALAASPEARAAERRLFGELDDPSLSTAPKRLLRRYGTRLTAFQQGLLRLGLDLGSPRYGALRVDLRHHRLRRRQFGALIELLSTVDGNLAVRELERRGVWLKHHPDALSPYLEEIAALSKDLQAGSLVADTTAILADRGLMAYIRRLAPLNVAALLPVDRLTGLVPPQTVRRRTTPLSTASSMAAQPSLSIQAKQQLGGLLDRTRTQLTLMLSAIQDAARRKASQLRSYLEAHRGEINGKVLLKLLFPEVPAGWALPYAMKWLEEEARRIRDTFALPDALKPDDGPANCTPAPAPRSRAAAIGAGASASCAGTLEIGPDSLAAGIPGVHYSQPLQAPGADEHLSWRVEGELPQGLSLNLATGAIEGRPRYLGVSEFTVIAQEDHGAIGRRPYTLTVDPPSCAGNPCAASYGNSEVTVTWGACGCTIPSQHHGLFGYYLEPIVNGAAGGSVGHPFVLGPLSVNAPDGSQGVPVFAGPGNRLWYTYPYLGSAGFDQAPSDQMSFGVYFSTRRDEDNELVLFPIGSSNTVTVK